MSLERCQTCRMVKPLCFCSELKILAPSTKVIVIVHTREIRKPTNTGRLAPLCLAGAELCVRGNEDSPSNAERFLTSEGSNLCLFPAEGANSLSKEFVSELKRPIHLFVPDGNWGQASRMMKREKALSNCIPVTLGDSEVSQYRIRRAPRQTGALATIEAIALALDLIDADGSGHYLRHIFRHLVERTLCARGQLKPRDVYGGGIPDRPF